MRTAIMGLVLWPFVLTAQQNDGAWTNTGPNPAAVEGIAVGPRGMGTIFIGTLSGGVRKSVDASGPQTVYAATFGGGLFKTDDGGGTWQNLPAITGTIASLAADPDRSRISALTPAIWVLAHDPADSQVIYAGTDADGIWKSPDAGTTWRHVGSNLFPTGSHLRRREQQSMRWSYARG
jgi:hypothetical protein